MERDYFSYKSGINTAREECFVCKNCKNTVNPQEYGSQYRNHCPFCLYSVHLDTKSGDRLRQCMGLMEPIAIWQKSNGEFAIIHHCHRCGMLKANRVAADDQLHVLKKCYFK
jgi:ribosome biogenesis GTPase